MGVQQLMGEGRKHSPKGQMTNYPVLPFSAPLQPAPPSLAAGRAGWPRGEWLVQLAHPPSFLGKLEPSLAVKLPSNPKEGV